MARIFVPPTAPLRPAAIHPEHPGFQLFKHFRPWEAGTNVFIVAGAVTTNEPDYEFVSPTSVFLGGHISPLTAAEDALLTAAGYGAFITTVPDAVVSPGLPGTPDPIEDPNLPVQPGLALAGLGAGPLGTTSLGGQ